MGHEKGWPASHMEHLSLSSEVRRNLGFIYLFLNKEFSMFLDPNLPDLFCTSIKGRQSKITAIEQNMKDGTRQRCSLEE